MMRKGYKHSIETKEKIRQGHIGQKMQPKVLDALRQSRLGKPSWNKGKKMSDEMRRKTSERQKGQVAHNKGKIGPRGADNKNWKGGDWKYWKLQAMLRDEYICTMCGFSEKEIMIVDHILPRSLYPELKFDINNLQTLCPNCNARKNLQDIRKYAVGRTRTAKWQISAQTS